MISRRLVVFSVAATAAVLLGGAVTVQEITDARWNALQQWTQEAWAAFQRRDFRRPVAWGESQPGNAFAHYRRAVALGQPLANEDRLPQLWGEFMLKRPRAGTEPMTAEQAAAIRASWAPAIAAARAGARCAEAGPAVDFREPDLDFNLSAARWLVNMMALEASEAVAQGDGRRAVELWLDALTFGTDLLRSPGVINRMIGGAVAQIVVKDGCTEEALQTLDGAQLEQLAAGLARIDAAALLTSSPADEAMMTAHYTLHHTQELAERHSATWRFGWSTRWMMADALLHLAHEAEQPAGDGQPWPVRQAQLLEHEQPAARLQTAGDRNPLLGAVRPPLWQSERFARQMFAHLRCLRIAVEHHRGAELPALSDPLGDGPLAVQRAAGELRIKSAGYPDSSWRIERIAALR